MNSLRAVGRMGFLIWMWMAICQMQFLPLRLPVEGLSSFVSKPERMMTYLALGDSYTVGESIEPQQSFAEQTVNLLNDSSMRFESPEIVARTGWTTNDLLGAIASKKNNHSPYDVVSLLIGVNNQYQGLSRFTYGEEFTALVQQSIAFAGGHPNRVFVLSIPDYSATPFGLSSNKAPFIAAEIDAYNQINKEISDRLGVNYINVTVESRKAAEDLSLVAGDGLHYSAKEYHRWAMMLAGFIKERI
jgi:lysophospholipase L1-like esterase